MTNKKIIMISFTIILLSLLVWWGESGWNCTDDGCESFFDERN